MKLKVPEYKLRKLHPADIAEIVDQLSINDSITILNSLDEEIAADALEEISPERQVTLFRGWTVNVLLNSWKKCHPDDAADLIGDLSAEKAEENFWI